MNKLRLRTQTFIQNCPKIFVFKISTTKIIIIIIIKLRFLSDNKKKYLSIYQPKQIYKLNYMPFFFTKTIDSLKVKIKH